MCLDVVVGVQSAESNAEVSGWLLIFGKRSYHAIVVCDIVKTLKMVPDYTGSCACGILIIIMPSRSNYYL